MSSGTGGVVEWGFDPVDDVLRAWDGWMGINTRDLETLEISAPTYENAAANFTLVARGQPYEDMAG